jgi:hypothetical protein
VNDTVFGILVLFLACVAPVLLAVVILKILHKPRFAEPLQRLKARSIHVIGWLLGVCVVLFVLWWFLPDDWKLKYAVQYWVSTDQVVIERKPHNCEWGSAPLGDKHCHYKALVMPLDPRGEVITAPGQTPTKVHVDWERVDE